MGTGMGTDTETETVTDGDAMIAMTAMRPGKTAKRKRRGKRRNRLYHNPQSP